MFLRDAGPTAAIKSQIRDRIVAFLACDFGYRHDSARRGTVTGRMACKTVA
jgi:hypothetical protein